MSAAPLAGRNAFVLGIERPAGRRAAVALAEAGANVAVCTLDESTAAEFAANSTANEFWALGRTGIALTSDGGATAVAEAIADATAELGPISIIVWHAPDSLSAAALTGARSDPAVIVLIAADAPPEEAAALLAWTRDLADGGLRANAIAAARRAVPAAPGWLSAHEAPDTTSVGAAVVHLASDASAAVEGALVVVDER